MVAGITWQLGMKYRQWPQLAEVWNSRACLLLFSQGTKQEEMALNKGMCPLTCVTLLNLSSSSFQKNSPFFNGKIQGDN